MRVLTHLSNLNMKCVLYLVKVRSHKQSWGLPIADRVPWGIQRYSFETSVAICANICLCSVPKLTGRIFIDSGIILLFSQFRDSPNATFIKFTAALLAPSTKNQVFQCFRYRLKHMSTMSWGFAFSNSQELTIYTILQMCFIVCYHPLVTFESGPYCTNICRCNSSHGHIVITVANRKCCRVNSTVGAMSDISW